jgi:single-strand DNA-binding protein
VGGLCLLDRRTAIAPYLKKGTQVYAEGTPDLRTYQKTDGTQGVSLTLRVLTVQLLGSRNSNEVGGNDSYASGSSGSMSGVPAAGEMTTPVDDLPF